MTEVRKEDVHKAFLYKRRKRNELLLIYYGDTLFIHNFNAEYIASKITQDLGIPMTSNMIYKLKRDYKKYRSKDSSDKNYHSGHTKPELVLQEKVQESSEPIIFKNTDDLPKQSPFSNAFAHLKKKETRN